MPLKFARQLGIRPNAVGKELGFYAIIVKKRREIKCVRGY
jgi:hypothetical protein